MGKKKSEKCRECGRSDGWHELECSLLPPPPKSPEETREANLVLKLKMLASIEAQGKKALDRVSDTLAGGHAELERVLRHDDPIAKKLRNVQAALRKINHEIAMNIELASDRVSDLVEVLSIKD